MDKSDTEYAFQRIRERASFELKCPQEKLTLIIVDSFPYANNARRARQIGVDGCDQRAIYVRVRGAPGSGWHDSWMLNSQSSPREH